MRRRQRSLVGKVVAITGGARGIGRATAAALISQGAVVALGDIDAELVRRTAAELGSGTLGLELDVTDRASFDAFLTEVQRRLGRLDVMINNAGIMPVGPFISETDATAERILEINVKGVLYGSRLALERFLGQGSGHLVNIASVAGKAGLPGGVSYCASKHAVVGLSEAIRQEVRGQGIDITIVMPVVVNTELGSGLSRIRGFGTAEPEDVARAIVAALVHRRVDVYVPRSIGPLLRSQAVLPRPVIDLVTRLLGGDRVLMAPDRAARAAYEARLAAETAGAGAGAAAIGAGPPAAEASGYADHG